MSSMIRFFLFVSLFSSPLMATTKAALGRDITYIEPGSYLELNQDIQIEPNSRFMTFTWMGITWDDASYETEILPYCHFMFTPVNSVRILPQKTRLEIVSVTKLPVVEDGILTESGFYGRPAYAHDYNIKFKNLSGHMSCSALSWTPDEKIEIRQFLSLMEGRKTFSVFLKESPPQIIDTGSM